MFWVVTGWNAGGLQVLKESVEGVTMTDAVKRYVKHSKDVVKVVYLEHLTLENFPDGLLESERLKLQRSPSVVREQVIHTYYDKLRQEAYDYREKSTESGYDAVCRSIEWRRHEALRKVSVENEEMSKRATLFRVLSDLLVSDGELDTKEGERLELIIKVQGKRRTKLYGVISTRLLVRHETIPFYSKDLEPKLLQRRLFNLYA